MNSPRKQAFTLVELLVVIVILVTLFGLLFPQNHQARENARQTHCILSMKQLQQALDKYETTHVEYPGYINTLGHISGNKTRASWVVKTFPYIEQTPLSSRWEQGEYAYSSIEILNCPSDPKESVGNPDLSYAANTGYIDSNLENKANGIFFDHTRTANGAPGPEDERDKSSSPEIIMTLDYIQTHDGATRTLLLAENTHALYWGYTTTTEQQTLPDEKYHFGFCWEQPRIVRDAIANDSPNNVRRINGNTLGEDYTSFKDMTPNDAFPTSNHPYGVNVAFVAGNVSFLSEEIDPLVYAQLMTPNASQSDLKNTEGKPESELEQPQDQY